MEIWVYVWNFILFSKLTSTSKSKIIILMEFYLKKFWQQYGKESMLTIVMIQGCNVSHH